MLCCSNCFKDTEIKAIIEADNIRGDCDFCNTKATYVYDIDSDLRLTELFDDVIDIYTVQSSLDPTVYGGIAKSLSETLHDDWDIFNLETPAIQALLSKICKDRFLATPYLFTEPVIIIQNYDPAYLDENSLLRNSNWHDFLDSIKYRNRFHNYVINTDILKKFLVCLEKTYHLRSIFYRARICTATTGFPIAEMGAPPVDKTQGGRANAEGIRILYLANKAETTFYETRASMFDYVTVGAFELQKTSRVVNLAAIDSISPFIGDRFGFDFVQYAVNHRHLKMIALEISRSMRKQDSLLDYVPTQYISDFIKALGFDGIEYISTMHSEGVNVAFFDVDSLNCINVETHRVNTIAYSHATI